MPLNDLTRICFVLLLIGINGCMPKHGKTLQVGSNHWIGYEPLYVAQDLGFYSDANIKITELSSASQVAKAFEQGSIELAALTLDEAIRLTSRENDYEILWVLDYSDGGDAIVAQSTISSMMDLRGRKVGLEEGAVSKYLLYRAAQINQMSIDDFEIVPVHLNLQEREFSLENITAVATFDPVKTRLLLSGAKQVFSSQQIPGEIIDVLVIKKDSYKQFNDQIKLLLEGYLKAVALIQKRDKTTLELLSRRAATTPSDIIVMLNNIHIPDTEEVNTMLYQKSPELQKQIQQLTMFLQKQGEIGNSSLSLTLMPSFSFPL